MTSPKTLLVFHNIRPKKQLGQHFLTDQTTGEMIVNRSGILPEDIVLEIGAGLGALTIPVARKASKVFAVDKDRKIIDILKTEILASNLTNVVIMEKNILKIDIESLSENISQKMVVMGNLPYNISSQILVQLIESRKVLSKAVVMLQKELAQRITAQPGCKDYGRLTVMLRYCSDIKKIADVKASLFFPRPKVDSEVLELKFKKTLEYPTNDEVFFFRVIKAAFGNRRKMLKNALGASALNIDANTAKDVLERSDIDPARRAETLTIEEFVKLSNNLESTVVLL
ncbi:MAG: ribosomal RNA small subunit methyltransferase A [Deltaproteobacteria bacterium]|nr:ribosomal RNA small subunit methyltransferase A [Deltaproteobacteria bacterium]MBW2620540.1 ribosomal RNA small subunit methyltransferase A [Deltaproteobacteria bacterium]MBW2642498.1 ribosomal RNA small subunit methyltransferase A [Deltaproteobacteria bacterium]